VNFAAITLYVASQRLFIFVRVYIVIDSVRKLLDTSAYTHQSGCMRNINHLLSLNQPHLYAVKPILTNQAVESSHGVIIIISGVDMLLIEVSFSFS